MHTLATYNTAIDANVDKAFLKSQGIEAHIENEHVANADPVLGMVIGVKLLVREEEAERARHLLNEFRTL